MKFLYRKRQKNWNLARRLRKFFCLERATIVRVQGASEDKKFAAKPTLQNSNFLAVFGIIPFFLCIAQIGQAAVHPIQFSVSETKIIQEIPPKDQDFAFLIPGDLNTYIFDDEEDYYRDYQRSYFALTWKKGGWDCMRHYEILANGCIPYFVDLEDCNPNTMAFLPKELILEAMHLEGVSYGQIDHTLFDRDKYNAILTKLLEHTRTYLTGRRMAQYILDTISYHGTGKILYLTQDPSPDYLRCCTLAGFKELLGDRIIDYPKIEHIYTNYCDNVKNLYGKGFTYTKIVDDVDLDRNDIEERIRHKEFDLIIYGSIHRGCPFHSLVQQTYEPDNIIYICGEDGHICPYEYLPHLFLREFDALLSTFHK